jgi:anti-sigma regulatory factor (Ser/Thr protein kinase)
LQGNRLTGEYFDPVVRFGVREQIVLISCVPLAFLIALLAIGFQLQRLSVQSAELSRHVTDTLSKADRVYESINDLFGEIKDYRKDRSPATLRRYQTSKAAIPNQLADVRRAVGPDPAAQARAKRFSGDAGAVVAILDRIFTFMRENRTAEANALSARPAVQKLGPEYLASKSAFDSGERSDSLARNTATRTKLQILSTALVLFTVVGIAVTLALAIGFGLRTGRRLRQLVANALLLAQQKPTLPIEGDDEIAEVDRVYHDMSRELEETTVLQHAMLPQRLPVVPGLRLDSAYLPAATHGKVGGDWFDVFPIDGKLLGISIGDVAGHGLSAASTMAMLRQTMRVAARIEQQPSSVLRHVNRSLCADVPAALATAIFATLDCTSGVLRWSTAGHPPPIVVRPDRSVTFLDGEGLILGVDTQTTFNDFTLELGVGSALVLYTDGLVEVERDYLGGAQALAEAVLAEYDESSAHIAENIQRRIFSRTAPRDDSAVLFLGVSSLGAVASEKRHVWHLDARDSLSARRVKRAVLWQLAGLAESPELPAVELIYGELLANVARHTPGPATVTLEWHDDVPVLHVDDRGPAFQMSIEAPADSMAESGRGFWLLSNYAAKLSVQRIGDANRVSVELPVGKLHHLLREGT